MTDWLDDLDALCQSGEATAQGVLTFFGDHHLHLVETGFAVIGDEVWKVDGVPDYGSAASWIRVRLWRV